VRCLAARLACLLDHPLLVTRPSERSAPLRYVGVRLADASPVDGPPSSAHDGRNCENRRLDRPCGAGCAFARIPETSQRLRRPIHISFNGRAHSGLRPNHHRPRGNLACMPALSPDSPVPLVCPAWAATGRPAASHCVGAHQLNDASELTLQRRHAPEP
jgi:hypothetical protein